MSDAIKHECGLAVVKLLKPLRHYRDKYGSATWGLDQLQLLMIKQRNRGQDGAGVAVVKAHMPMGEPYIVRKRSAEQDPVQAVFESIHGEMAGIGGKDEQQIPDEWLKKRFPFLGETYLGHLRYGTHGTYGPQSCHPFVRHNNWASRNLVLAGNFNLTNTDEIFDRLVSYGQRPIGLSDALTLLEKIGHFLDEENERLYQALLKQTPAPSGQEMAKRISEGLRIERILLESAKYWDGGYTLGGMVGNGDAFVFRDPNGIRPAYWYRNDEVVAMASERAALTTVFNVEPEQVKQVTPGCVLSMRHTGEVAEHRVLEAGELKQCTFERIYFSRGNDPAIYEQRKKLGRNLAEPILNAVKWDAERTVFSYIPNTAETAFLGLTEGAEELVRKKRAEELWGLAQAGRLSREDLERLTRPVLRVEKAAHKDQKLRTFIAQDQARRDLVSHVYDITRGVCGPEDTLVVLDDSIVRGTTLRDSILTMLTRLKPKRIIVASSAPPIKYPDCYGIDMSELGRFVAFEAAVSLRRERGEERILREVEEACRAQADAPIGTHKNLVQRIYAGISEEELSVKIGQIITPRDCTWQGEIKIIYQTIAGLRSALPNHRGDWYFTGEYPTPGGYKVLNTAYLNYCEKRSGRAYS